MRRPDRTVSGPAEGIGGGVRAYHQNHALVPVRRVELRLVVRAHGDLVVRRARRDHRIDVLVRIDANVGDRRPRRRDHLVDRRVEFVRPRRAQADGPEGFRELHEIRQGIHVALGVASAEEELLPLADHAHPAVVEDEDLHRKPVLGDGGHLLDVHQHRGLAGHVDDQRVGMGDLHAHGGRQTVAHRAEAARGHPAVGLLEADELRRPHLVLADLGGDVDVVAQAQAFVEKVERVLRLDDVGRRPVAERPARAPSGRSCPTIRPWPRRPAGPGAPSRP